MVDTDEGRSIGRGEVLGLLLLVVAVGVLAYSETKPAPVMPVAPGTLLPPLMAEGWLNVGNPSQQGRGIPSVETLRGKIVVVDCWATWCVPCRAAMPKLAKLHEQYSPLGVEFLGLTPERETELPSIERFLRAYAEVTWPIGYGAGPTLDMLGSELLPTLVVYGPDGRALWSGHHTDGLSDVLDRALAVAD